MFTIGADPEILLCDKVGNPRAICGKLGGSKYEPKVINKRISISEDNVAAEFTIPPSSKYSLFDSYLEEGIGIIRDMAEKIGLRLSDKSSAIYPNKELRSDQAMVFGCEPDFNIYNLDTQFPPSLSELAELNLHNLRSAGGHIHIGMLGGEFDKILFSHVLEYHVGLWCTLNDPNTGPRKTLYGRAGSIRFTPYGLEYRTPSNFWIFNSNLRKSIYDLVARSVDMYINDTSTSMKIQSMGKTIRKVIDGDNKLNAEKLSRSLAA